MSCRKMVTAVMDKFKSDMDDIVASVESAGRLTPEMAAKVEKELGDAAMAAAREGYRAFIESFDVDTPVLEVDGEVYRRKLRSSKKVMTLLGDVTVKRHLYQRDRGGASHAPVDTAWGMAGQRATPHVREAVLFAMAHLPPVEVVALLEKSAWFHPSTTLVKRETVKAGDVIEAGEESLMAAVRAVESAPAGVRCMAASLDGVNVLLNEPGKPKGRPRERPYAETGETGKTSYRNAMVGSISFYGEVPEAGHSPVRLAARYVARMPEKKAPTFKHCLEEELKHTEDLVGPEVVKLLLVDAHRGIWCYVEGNDRFAGYEKAVDFYHATEHLSRAAEALLGKSSSSARAWYQKWYCKLRDESGAAKGVIRAIRYLLKTRKLSSGSRKEAQEQMTYFVRNQRYMPYAELRQRGLPIGSGPVEAACKSIVKTRFCRSGMRWSRHGGQNVLHLRTIVKSGRWEAFWNEYNAQQNVALSA